MRTQRYTERESPGAKLFITVFALLVMVGVAIAIATQLGWTPPHLFGTAQAPDRQEQDTPKQVNNPRGNPIVIPVQPQIVDLVPPTPAAPLPPNVDALANPALPARPVIDETQARQLDQAAELAAQEAAQEYLDGRRVQELAAPVKMDAQQVEQTYGRDPCHAPRADPATCGRGIVEATPLNEVQP